MSDARAQLVDPVAGTLGSYGSRMGWVCWTPQSSTLSVLVVGASATGMLVIECSVDRKIRYSELGDVHVPQFPFIHSFVYLSQVFSV